jgi:hypothetical protein
VNGSILIFKPNASEPEIRDFVRALDLDDLKDAIGGGWIEAVPGFHSIELDDKLHRCVVLVDEEGKLGHRTSGKPTPSPPDPPNPTATKLWHLALRRLGHPGLVAPGGGLADYLCGQVAVVIGDDEFLSAL